MLFLVSTLDTGFFSVASAVGDSGADPLREGPQPVFRFSEAQLPHEEKYAPAR